VYVTYRCGVAAHFNVFAIANDVTDPTTPF